MFKSSTKIMYLSILMFVFLVLAGTKGSCAERIDIHGFGSWAFSDTDGPNNYLMARPNRSWDYYDFALNLNAQVDEKVRVNAQLYAEGGLQYAKTQENENDTESSLDVDYAFVEYAYSDYLKIRGGKVKHPFGIYGELLKVGTVRPFFFLPTTIYGRMGIVANGYKGIGILGRKDLNSNFSISYDIYTGEVDVEVLHTWHAVEGEEIFHPMHTKDVIGGRIVIDTPIEGLSFGASGYSGMFEMEGTKAHQNVFGFQASFVRDRFGLRGEYAQTKLGTNKTIKGAYAEGDYLLTEHWQIALCYEWSKVTLELADNPLDKAPSLGKHTAFNIGLNYIVNPNLILRASTHFIKDNRFAYPDDVATSYTNLDTTTFMYLLGVNFSF